MQNLMSSDEQTVQILERIVPKAAIPESAEYIVGKLLEVGSSLEAYVRLTNLIAILEAAQESVKEKAMVQVGGVKTVSLGAEVITKKNPSRWDYHGDAKAAKLSADLKAHQAMLQGLTKEMVDPETGEIYQPATKIPGGEHIEVKF